MCDTHTTDTLKFNQNQTSDYTAQIMLNSAIEAKCNLSLEASEAECKFLVLFLGPSSMQIVG